MALDIKDYKDILKKENLKNTKHRNSILEVIEESSQPITADSIYLKLKEQGVSISFSTVYRVLDTLIGKGLIIKTSVTDENKGLYEINSMEHKHHLLCVKCRRMLSVDGCPLEEYERELEEKLGFSIKGHKLEMFGLCDKCKDSDK
jgi:Fur family ferric uptake transcriptional regulator